MKRLLACFSAATVMTLGSALAAPAEVRVEGSPPGNYVLLASIVQYGDLDISTNSGAETLLERIDQAALKVCGAKEGKKPAFVAETDFENCSKHAVADAVAAVHVPMLTKVAAAH